MTEDEHAAAHSHATSRIRIVPRSAVALPLAPILEPLVLPSAPRTRPQPDTVTSAIASFGCSAFSAVGIALCLVSNMGGAPSSGRAEREARASERRAAVERALLERGAPLGEEDARRAR